MSLQLLAQDMASRGRGPDTMLVHMAPSEVHGLQALARAHGGSLTVNPETGLPEAGFLSAILPLAAGMFLGPAGAGLFSSALTAGLGVGAATGLMTGSLQKGLMAGLGAYGGAGLGASIAGAAPVAPVTTAASPTADVLTEALNPNIASAATTPAASGVVGGAPAYMQGVVDPFAGYPAAPVTTATYAPPTDFGASEAFVQPNVTPANYMPSASFGASEAAVQPGVTAANYTPPGYTPPTTTTTQAPAGAFDKFKAGLGAIYDKPDLILNKENLRYGLSAGMPIASYMMQPKKQAMPKEDREQYRYAYNPGREMPPSREGDMGEYTYFRPTFTRLAADGGLMDLPVERMSERNAAETMLANGGQMYAGGGEIGNILEKITTPRDSFQRQIYSYNPETQQYAGGAPAAAPVGGVSSGGGGYQPARYAYNPATQSYTLTSPESDIPPPSLDVSGWSGGLGFAGGGISHLGDYSDGGRLLRGPGDGVSDDIPATIANKRPARLANNEFVIPARIVSEIGNGSTDAGAKRLYAMMDRVQKRRARTVGKGKVAVDSGAHKEVDAL